MKNRIRLAKLGRPSKHRMDMLKNMATALFKHERIRTTVAKAKALSRFAEKQVTRAKKGTRVLELKVRRNLREEDVADKVLTELAERYAARPGGYTRVLRAGWRRGDHAPMAVIEMVDRAGEIRPARPVSRAEAAAAEAVAAGEAEQASEAATSARD